jgi:hypothetical protein
LKTRVARGHALRGWLKTTSTVLSGQRSGDPGILFSIIYQRNRNGETDACLLYVEPNEVTYDTNFKSPIPRWHGRPAAYFRLGGGAGPATCSATDPGAR